MEIQIALANPQQYAMIVNGKTPFKYTSQVNVGSSISIYTITHKEKIRNLNSGVAW